MKHYFKITFELDSQKASIDRCIVIRDGQSKCIMVGTWSINDTLDKIKDILVNSLENIERR